MNSPDPLTLAGTPASANSRNPAPPSSPAPNFFILGAAKCGTTSLFHYLRAHPDVFLPWVKEPMFFNKGYRRIKSERGYARLFEAAGSALRVGEASHSYLTDPRTAAILHARFPAAKCIIILRNPADRAYSLYHHMKRNGFEPASTFEAALGLEEQRFASKRFRKSCPDFPWNYFYFRSGLFGEQVERYFRLFDPAQFHILTLNALIKHPRETFSSLLSFLEVDESFEPEFEVHLPGEGTARFAPLQVFARSRMETRGPRLRSAGRWIRKMNLKPVPPMNPATRSALLGRYADDLMKLEHLTGIGDLAGYSD